MLIMTRQFVTITVERGAAKAQLATEATVGGGHIEAMRSVRDVGLMFPARLVITPAAVSAPHVLRGGYATTHADSGHLRHAR